MAKDPFADQEDPASVFFGLFKVSLSYAIKRFRPRRKVVQKESEHDSNDAFDPALRPSKKLAEEKAAAEANAEAEKDAKKAATASETLATYLATSTSTLTKIAEVVNHTAKNVAAMAQTPQTVNVQNNQQNISQSLALAGKVHSREVNALLNGKNPQPYLEQNSLTRSGKQRQ